jgi:hypothetical protein
MASDAGGCAGPPSQAAFMMPLSIHLAKLGSVVPNADTSRTASIGDMSRSSGLPGAAFTLILGGFLRGCLPPLPEISVSTKPVARHVGVSGTESLSTWNCRIFREPLLFHAPEVFASYALPAPGLPILYFLLQDDFVRFRAMIVTCLMGDGLHLCRSSPPHRSQINNSPAAITAG